MNTTVVDGTSIIASVTPQFLSILGALVILIVGVFVAKVIRGLSEKALQRVKFLRANPETKQTDHVKPVASLIYYIVLLNVLILVLGQLGLTSVLNPLTDLASQFVGYLPKIIGAGIVTYVGWVLATIFASFTRIALAKFDEKTAEKFGSDTLQVSKLGGAIVFGTVLLPIVVAALGILNIDAISIPATDMIHQLMDAVPKILAAAIILGVTYAVTKFVIYMLTGLLDGLHVNELPAKMGLESLFTTSFTPIKLITGLIFFFSMLFGFVAAVEKLQIQVLTQILAKVIDFGGNILVGGVILVIGNFLSLLAYDKMIKSSNTGLANIARFAILGLVLAMGLKTMGLADSIVNMAFGATISSIAVAVALAFGLGGRDAAKSIADKWASRMSKED